MITPVTSAQKTLLRSGNQFARLSLVVFRPNILATTTLTASVPRWGLFLNVSSTVTVRRGSLLIVNGVRVIARGPATWNSIPVYPTSVPLMAGMTVTVTDEIEAVGGRITNESLDYGTAWTTAYRSYSPVPVMGGDSVVRIGETLTRESHSWHPAGAAITHLWECPGATVTGATTPNPSLTFSARGNYRLTLTVSSGGTSAIGYRRVLVVDDTDLIPVRLDSVSAQDYHSATVEVSAGLVSLGERVAIVATTERYGNTSASFGQARGSENIILSGYVSRITRVKSETGAIDRLEISGWAKLERHNPLYRIERVFNPEISFLQLRETTLRKFIWHFAFVQTNIGEVMDVWADAGVVLPTVELTRLQMGEQLREIASMVAGTAAIDRWGRLAITRDADITGSAPLVMEIEPEDVLAQYEWRADGWNHRAIAVSGIAVRPFTAQFNVYAIAPGNAHDAPDIFNVDGLAVSGQDELNQIAARLYGRYNFPVELHLTLAQNNRLIDIAPAQIVRWAGKDYVVRGVEWKYENETGIARTALTLYEIPPAGTAEVMTVPIYDEDSGTIDEIQLPPTSEPPELPPITFPPAEPPTPEDPTSTREVLANSIFLLTNSKLLYCFDADNPVAPTWQAAGGVFLPANMTTLAYFGENVYVGGQYYVLSARKPEMKLEYRFDPGKIIQEYGLTWDMRPNAEIGAFGVHSMTGETVMLVGRLLGAKADLWVDFKKKAPLLHPPLESWGYRGAFVPEFGFLASHSVMGNGRIVTFGTNWNQDLSVNVSDILFAGAFEGTAFFRHRFFRTVWRTTDLQNFAETAIQTNATLGLAQNLILFVDFGTLKKSTDNGQTSQIVNLPSGFSVQQVFCLDANNWIVSGRLNALGMDFSAVYRTDDGGTTWWPMYSNLPDIVQNENVLDMIVVP